MKATSAAREDISPSSAPVPRARFEARITPDGSVVLPLRLVGPVLSEVFGKEQSAGTRPSAGGADLATVLARELVQGILQVGRDSPSLLDQVAGIIGSASSQGAPGVLLMKKQEYAEHIAYSVRTLDKLIDAGLPTRGKGRRLRIPVREADQWMLAQEADKLDDIDLLATRNAKKPRRSGGSNG